MAVAIRQIEESNKQGDGIRLATTDGSYTAGNVPMYDSAGKLVNSGKTATQSVKPQWSVGSGEIGTTVGGYVVAPLGGAITTGRIVITASDASTDLTFDIKKNGTSIFSSARTITHGASAHAVTDLTSALTSTSISVAAGDYFELDISSGSAGWVFMIVMA